MKRRRYLIDDSIHPVFITTTIVNWIPVFAVPQIAIDSLRMFETMRSEINMTVNAFVLMPNHFHAIVQSQNKGDISTLIRKWKSMSAKNILEYCKTQKTDWLNKFAESSLAHKLASEQKHQVWMPRFDDYAIRDEREFLIKLNYIHGNPLKHGLADDCADYPYSSFNDYHDGKNGFITVRCGHGKP